MAIAEVIDVKNSVFINGSPASDDQMIDYGDVIETYDISKGLQESFLSEEIEDDGILTIQFIEKEEEMSIKPHCKVIFKPGGAWAGANTVLLDSKSEYVTLDKPKFRKTKAVAVVVKAKMSNINGLEAKPGIKLWYEDVIKTGGDGFLILVYLEDKQLLKIRESTTFTLFDPTTAAVRKSFLKEASVFGDGVKHPQGFLIQVPIHVAAIKG
jgi:hypothetical protein